MNIAKNRLKQIIKEEVENYVNERIRDTSDLEVGSFLEISVSDDGYEHAINKIEPDNYRNIRGPYTSFKALVNVIQVAKPGEDY